MADREYRQARRKRLLEYIRRADVEGRPTLDYAKHLADLDGYSASGTAWVMALSQHLGEKAKRKGARKG